MKKSVQIITIAFALSMLIGYVVYSQRQQSRAVAPGSKTGVLAPREPTAAPASEPAVHPPSTTPSSGTAAEDAHVTMPGSKSYFPAVKVRLSEIPATNVPIKDRSEWIPHMTSKFGRVFEPSPAIQTNAGPAEDSQ